MLRANRSEPAERKSCTEDFLKILAGWRYQAIFSGRNSANSSS